MKKPKMIGANIRKIDPRTRRRGPSQASIVAEFNAGFDHWAKDPKHLHLGYRRVSFNQ